MPDFIESLRIRIERPDPLVDHILRWLSTIWHVRIDFCAGHESEAEKEVDLYYGSRLDVPARVRIPRTDSLSTPAETLSDFDVRSIESQSGVFPADFFATVRHWLLDEAHAALPTSAFDAHGRLRFSAAVHGQGADIAQPIVGRYVLLLTRMMEQAVGRSFRPIWPDGKKAAVILSHDVDAPLDQGSIVTGMHQAAIRWRRGQRAGALYSVASTARQVATRALRGRLRPDERWLFGPLMESEARRGFRSTFFFASRHCWSPGASPRDVRYDLSAVRFKPVFEEMLKRGFEPAIHASYNVHRDCGLLAEEIEWLRAASGCDVQGNRHHFWRLDRPWWNTLRCHARCGLKYDSSIAFNDGLGWRQGIPWPYEPWDPENGRPIPVLQIPVMLMDGVLWYDTADTAESTERNLARFDALVDALVRHRAAGSIDWHACSSYPARSPVRHWGQGYQAILDRLAARSDVWVTTCREMSEYWRARQIEGQS